jgi:hypothetical protein
MHPVHAGVFKMLKQFLEESEADRIYVSVDFPEDDGIERSVSYNVSHADSEPSPIGAVLIPGVSPPEE